MRLSATHFTKGNFVKRKRKSKGLFVAMPKATLNAPAWRAMSPEGRLLCVFADDRFRRVRRATLPADAG
jgi:hypothetical protein